jgi:hypothetical protein
MMPLNRPTGSCDQSPRPAPRAGSGREAPMATLGLIAFTGLIAAQFLSVVYAANYGR